jgi:hypothetical protein
MAEMDYHKVPVHLPSMQEPEAMQPLIDLTLADLDELRKVEPEITKWLKEALTLAHTDKRIKGRISLLLGTFFYTGNLTFLGSWNPLKEYCRTQALAMGAEMKSVFEDEGLGEILGSAAPNVYGKVRYHLTTQRFEVIACEKREASRRQDSCMAFSFPRDTRMSQFWNEKCYIQCVRLIGLGLNAKFQQECERICKDAMGQFKACHIKGFSRMMNKCLSKEDHYYDEFPRPALNIDINRNASTFERADQLLQFIDMMKGHEKFGGSPVRLKNMFLYGDEEAAQQFYYRTVMVNWLYTPGITYGELATESRKIWDAFYDYNSNAGFSKAGFSDSGWFESDLAKEGPGRFGDMDQGENWASWREQISVARKFLEVGTHALFPLHMCVHTPV